MADVDKIILERTEDGEHWKLQTEGNDVEGHAARVRFRGEPAGKQQDGQELYKVDFGDEDTEGHGYTVRWSDGRLKQSVRPL